MHASSMEQNNKKQYQASWRHGKSNNNASAGGTGNSEVYQSEKESKCFRGFFIRVKEGLIKEGEKQGSLTNVILGRNKNALPSGAVATPHKDIVRQIR